MMNALLIHTFLRLYCRTFIGVALLCIAPLATHAQSVVYNQASDPMAVMQVAINDVLTALKDNELLYKSNPQALRDVVAKSALPNFNITRMAQLALAKHWRGASAQQREVYVYEFQRYLIRSYTETLYFYRNSKPEMVVASISDKNENKATVKIYVDNDNREKVTIFLRVERTDGVWKIVDVNVEGVSLVITTRGVFDEEINKIGLDDFLKNLAAENNRMEKT